MRAGVRCVALTAITVPSYLGLLVTKPVGLVSRRGGLALESFWVRVWARACARALGVDVTARGEPPRPPFFLASNHLSYLDIVVLATLVDARFLAKSEIARWPIAGLLARSVGTLFIERERARDLTRVLPAIQSRLDLGHGVVVFPEGTSTKGAEVLRFKPSLFEVALRTRAPVRTASLSYATPSHAPPAHLAVCWWGDAPFLGHFLRLLMLPRIRATVAFGGSEIRAEDRKSLAALAQRAVEDQFTPVVEDQIHPVVEDPHTPAAGCEPE